MAKYNGGIKLDNKLQQKLDDYEAILGEDFPLMEVRGMATDKIIERIDECLYERKFYDELFPIDNDSLY